MPSVFVSYSHKDKSALEQLRRHFKPLEKRGLVTWWDDSRIHVGAKWEPEIEEALESANVAVLLITADFLASEYIATKELPRILARHASGDLHILPVFLKPSVVDDDALTFPIEGTGRSMKLTALQGFGTPDRPLSDWNESDREREFVRLAKHITSLAAAGLPLPKNESEQPAANVTSPTRPGATLRHDCDLVVHLTPGSDSVQLSYQDPHGRPLQGGSHRLGISAVAAIGRGLDAGHRDVLSPGSGHGTPVGPALFDLLLPDWETVLPQVHASDKPKPTPYRPVRVRIATDVPLLSGLPWRVTTWHGEALLQHGWTFAVTSPAGQVHHVETKPTSTALFLGGSTDPQGQDGGSQAARAVKDVIESLWVGRPTWRAVRDCDTLRGAFDDGLRPHFIYVYGRVSTDSDIPCLLLTDLEGEKPIPVAEFASMLEALDPRPAALYLDVTWHPRVSPQALTKLCGVIPLVLWRRLPQREADSTTRAVTWLRRWLAEAEDPVTAWHEAQRSSQALSVEATSVVLHADYAKWETNPLPAGQRPEHPRLVLDRRKPKAILAEDVRALAENAERRVLAFVATATQSHSVAYFGAQVERYLQAAVRHVPLKRVRLDFPAERAGLWSVLRESLDLQLGRRDGESVQEMLKRHAPPSLSGHARRVLWLDWGALGAGHETTLTEEELSEWVRFAAEFLVDHCPPKDLRLMTSVSFELGSDASCDRLLALLDSLHEEDWHDRRAGPFRLSDLPALERVPRGEYFDFMSTQAGCEESLRQEVAKLLYRASEGDFDKTVALIEEAQKGSWYALRERLRREDNSRRAAGDAGRRIE